MGGPVEIDYTCAGNRPQLYTQLLTAGSEKRSTTVSYPVAASEYSLKKLDSQRNHDRLTACRTPERILLFYRETRLRDS
jgi:hypothetical protein